MCQSVLLLVEGLVTAVLRWNAALTDGGPADADGGSWATALSERILLIDRLLKTVFEQAVAFLDSTVLEQ